MNLRTDIEDQIFEINLDKICFVVLKAREFETITTPVDIDTDSSSLDDLDLDILEARRDDSAYDELHSFINGLNEDEALDLIALMWVGRGTFEAEDFQEARTVAAKEGTHTPAEYLLGTPLLAEHLQNGMDSFGLSCEDAETIHL